LDRAIRLEQHDIALDDDNALAHAVLGRMYQDRGQYDEAAAEGERAIALAPGSALVNLFMAWILDFAKPAEAIAYVEQAERLNLTTELRTNTIEALPTFSQDGTRMRFLF
jgi:Tfp pilus assembly protein PilF